MPHRRKDSPDIWQIRVGGIRQSSGTTNREAAARLEHKLNHEAFETAKLGICHDTWDKACLEWITEHEHKLRSIEIQKAWGRYWKQHLTGKRLRNITPEMVKAILLKREGVSESVATKPNNTANQYADFVGKILRSKNVPFKWKDFPQLDGREEWLRLEQWRALDAVMSSDFRQVATFSLATGLREANVISMQWDWVRGNTLLIPSTAAKTGVAYGVPLNRTCLGIIAARRAEQVVHHSNVFTFGGKEIYCVQLNRAWQKAQKAAGIDPPLTYHDLRHTYASWMVQAGVPFEIVARLCHWRQKGMVHKYSHFDVESLRPWAEKMDEILDTKSSQASRNSA